MASAAAAEAAAEPDATTPAAAHGTWSCEHCSLENEEPNAESLLKDGGVLSCAACCKVKDQDSWQCPDCGLINALKTNTCKVCQLVVALARSRKGGGSRSEAAAIARDYKKRRRVQPKGGSRSSLTPSPGPPDASPTPGADDSSGLLPAAKMELEREEEDGGSVVEAVRVAQSEIFAQQLRAMHRAIRELGHLSAFRAGLTKSK